MSFLGLNFRINIILKILNKETQKQELEAKEDNITNKSELLVVMQRIIFKMLFFFYA
jgi:hypothetical protein